MAQTLTKEEVEAQLKQKTDAITRRIDAIEDEVSTSGAVVKKAFGNPLLAVGATILAGVAVGVLLGGGRRKKRKDTQALPRAVFDAYFEVVAGEAEEAIAAGADPHDALRDTLRKRAPLVISLPSKKEASGGLLKQTARFAIKTTTSMLIRKGRDMLLARLLGDEAGAEPGGNNGQAGPGETS